MTRRPVWRAALLGTCLLLTVVHAQRAASEFYAATDGQSDGDGSRQRPWDLQTALNQPATVQPGDIIWIRGGVYTGAFVSRLKGRDGAHITLRAYAAERPILDNPTYNVAPPLPPLSVEGPFVTVWGLEVTSSNPERVARVRASTDFRPTGINVLAPHTKLINNIVHDTGNCLGHWSTATDAEVYGNLLYFCGWDGADRGHGHGLYIQNAGGIKEVRENIVFDDFGYGLHAYTEGGAIDDLRFRRNVVFESSAPSAVKPGWAGDILVGGGKVAQRPVLDGNFTYRAHGSNNLGFAAGTDHAVVTGNYFVEGNGVALSTIAARNLLMSGNTLVGSVSDPVRHSDDNTLDDAPHGTWRFVLPNAYDAGRTTVVIYNWDKADAVLVDVAGFLEAGDAYEIHNVQDYFADIVKRTYDSGPIVFPMRDRSVGTPIGWRSPQTTFPTFGVFVVTKTGRAIRH